ncbi:MAG: hypothetical protein O3B04_01725 [Chloroflexi bacterium]|nr:hypothetical protein [Chloroflexota bacterium]MDA1296707.1 hypothetical protein [Chloroflexota bacterium]
MCRSTAAPLMAMAGMAGTAIGVAIAVLREKADRRSIEREVKEEEAAARVQEVTASDEAGHPDGAGPDTFGQSDEKDTKNG